MADTVEMKSIRDVRRSIMIPPSLLLRADEVAQGMRVAALSWPFKAR